MKRAIVALAILSAIAMTAQAGESSAPVRVTASVVPNCQIEVRPMDFGTYDPLQAHATTPLQAQSELLLLCTRQTPAAIEFDAGFYGVDTRARALGLGGIRLNYGLFSDAARSFVWGTGPDAVTLSGSEERPDGEPLRLTVYGSIPSGQEVQAGDYTDIVTARVSF